MQSAPQKLSQALWAAFRASKPQRHGALIEQFRCFRSVQQHARTRTTLLPRPTITARFYSEKPKSLDVEQKVADAKKRIHNSLDARAEIVSDARSPLREEEDETVIHTNPESSSIVYKKGERVYTAGNASRTPQSNDTSLPSQKAGARWQGTTRASQLMDEFQSKIFLASQRLNDLTGYTGIERLKREIDQQESSVQAARQAVKDNRTKYSEAIAMRSATQREVNDLLQRKHAWSPQDLERFTNLYRSDHANEQSEQQAHQQLSEAEVRYEEASTKLAKSILARYHEEQIWSDKIRQMSTWGTWGLMGLNILLFVVLQLAIEPWRRRRLVRGFEEKVEVALASREKENQELKAQLRQQSGGGVVVTAAANKPEPVVAAAGEKVAEAIVDAITGSTGDGDSTSAKQRNNIEAAIEQATTKELRNEMANTSTVAQTTESIAEGGSPDVPVRGHGGGTSGTSQPAWSRIPTTIYTGIIASCVSSYDTVCRQFDTTTYIVLSRRQITANFVEGLATGVAIVGGVMVFMARNR